jgi:hypothetical protein
MRVAAPVEALPPLSLEPKPPGTPKPALPPAAASKLGAAVMARRSRRDLGSPPALPPKKKQSRDAQHALLRATSLHTLPARLARCTLPGSTLAGSCAGVTPPYASAALLLSRLQPHHALPQAARMRRPGQVAARHSAHDGAVAASGSGEASACGEATACRPGGAQHDARATAGAAQDAVAAVAAAAASHAHPRHKRRSERRARGAQRKVGRQRATQAAA